MSNAKWIQLVAITLSVCGPSGQGHASAPSTPPTRAVAATSPTIARQPSSVPEVAPAVEPAQAPTAPPADPLEPVLLATPFAGSCRFGDCLKNGWDGDVHADCKFSDCAKDGWSARGQSTNASTDCSFQKCFESGWSTRLADGGRIDVSCHFGDCLKDGWSARMGSDSVDVRCQFSDCTKNGFDMTRASECRAPAASATAGRTARAAGNSCARDCVKGQRSVPLVSDGCACPYLRHCPQACAGHVDAKRRAVAG